MRTLPFEDDFIKSDKVEYSNFLFNHGRIKHKTMEFTIFAARVHTLWQVIQEFLVVYRPTKSLCNCLGSTQVMTAFKPPWIISRANLSVA